MDATTTAIVVNWNGAAVLDDCLRSLETQTRPVEVIVVDNGSVDESEEIVRRHGAGWVPLRTNTGLAHAFNVGAEIASDGVLLFLNNDLALPYNFVKKIAEMMNDEEIGVVDAGHLNWDETAATHQRVTFRPRRYRPMADDWFTEQSCDARSQSAFASGACFAVRSRTFKQVGGWDAGFFAGWEDVDMSWRLRLAGLRVEFEPTLTIRHHVSASSHSPEGQRARTYAAMTGRPRFAIKHAPVEVAALSVLRLLAGAANDVRSPARFKMRGRAIAVTARDLAGLIRWRRKSYRTAQTTPRKLWKQIAVETA